MCLNYLILVIQISVISNGIHVGNILTESFRVRNCLSGRENLFLVTSFLRPCAFPAKSLLNSRSQLVNEPRILGLWQDRACDLRGLQKDMPTTRFVGTILCITLNRHPELNKNTFLETPQYLELVLSTTLCKKSSLTTQGRGEKRSFARPWVFCTQNAKGVLLL